MTSSALAFRRTSRRSLRLSCADAPMADRDDTTTDQILSVRDDLQLVPGLLVVFENRVPTLRATPIGVRSLAIGRGTAAAFFVDDPKLSRVHCEVSFDGTAWRIDDRSRHGCFVDGVAVQGSLFSEAPRTLRIGESVLVFDEDVTPFLGETIVVRGDFVLGPQMRAAERDIVAAAEARGDLFVIGETGTGKEWAAETYHRASGRSGPLVKVNCATLPQALFESEVFGYVRGAFSGADRDRPGLFEAANGGTLFLDEVGELPIELQPKLLRAIEERAVRRVGDTRERPVDVTLVAATNRDLEQAVDEGTFRADLYYRFDRGNVRLPPLRERPEDIPFLVRMELDRLKAPPPSAPFMEELLLRPWTGNIRDLVKTLSSAVTSASRAPGRSHPRLDASDLPPRPAARPNGSREVVVGGLTASRLRLSLQQHGSVSAAASALGVHRNTLHRHMKRLGIRAR